jgi:hypothetical protein
VFTPSAADLLPPADTGDPACIADQLGFALNIALSRLAVYLEARLSRGTRSKAAQVTEVATDATTGA